MGKEKIESEWKIKEEERKRETSDRQTDRQIEGPLKFHEMFIDG